MRYISAAATGGTELGFERDEAKEIVRQTVRGAVGLEELATYKWFINGNGQVRD